MPIKFSAAFFMAGIVLATPLASAATTCDSVAACVLGNNTGSGVGLEGVSQNNVALYGVSTANHGIDGRSRQSYGVVGYTFADGTAATSSRAGVYGIDSGTGDYNTGVFGQSINGDGVRGQSTNGTGLTGEGEFGVAGVGTEIGVGGFGSNFGGYFANGSTTTSGTVVLAEGAGMLLEGGSSNTGTVVSIDGAGNEILVGTLMSAAAP